MKIIRREDIVHFVQRKGATSLDELCTEFKVSKNTIRRDIQYLVDNKRLQKVYGGVRIPQEDLVPFVKRSSKMIAEKEKIGKRAAEQIHNDDLIYIDSGTTTKMIMPYLPKDLSITVLTNSLDIINAAIDLPNTHFILVGHTYKHSTRSFVGENDSTVLTQYNISKAFMAATGVSIANGLTNSDFLEYQIKKTVCEKASQIFLLADHTKFDHSTLMTYTSLAHINCIITDLPLPSYQTFCQQQNITIEIVT